MARDLKYDNDEFTFPEYECVRRRLPNTVGHLAIDQAGGDIRDQAARLLAMQVMTVPIKRIRGTLTTSGNWGQQLRHGHDRRWPRPSCTRTW